MKIKQKTCLFSQNINSSFFQMNRFNIKYKNPSSLWGFLWTIFFSSFPSYSFLILRSIWQIKDRKYDTICLQEFDQFRFWSHQKHINFILRSAMALFICLCEHSHYFYDTKSCWISGLCEIKSEKQKKILKRFKNDKKSLFIWKAVWKNHQKRQKSSLEWKTPF
jgi:hypothetical protein